MIIMFKYIDSTCKDKLVPSAENIYVIKCYVDASFAVHTGFNSHDGDVMILGGVAIQSISCKNNLNIRINTEAEVVGADDASTMILWKIFYMVNQG